MVEEIVRVPVEGLGIVVRRRRLRSSGCCVWRRCVAHLEPGELERKALRYHHGGASCCGAGAVVTQEGSSSVAWEGPGWLQSMAD